MNSRLLFIVFIALQISSCQELHPVCSILKDGVYPFPELPKDHGLNKEDRTRFLDLPKPVCQCLSTEGLIETCLNYPELRLIMAGANPQSGYNLLVKERFLGIRELEKRPDRGSALLKKYQSMDPLGFDPDWDTLTIGRYNFNIYFTEIIFSQYINLQPLAELEKIELLENAISIYEMRRSEYSYFHLWGLEVTATLLGRLMILNDFQPMKNAYAADYWVRELIDFYGPTKFEVVELIYELSKQYLEQIKK